MNRNKCPILEALKNTYMHQETTKLIDRLVMGIILNVSFASKKNLFSKQTSLTKISILGIDFTYNIKPFFVSVSFH